MYIEFLSRGGDIILIDRVCISGCTRCVDACTPLILLHDFVVSYHVPDIGYLLGTFTCFVGLSHHQALF